MYSEHLLAGLLTSLGGMPWAGADHTVLALENHMRRVSRLALSTLCSALSTVAWGQQAIAPATSASAPAAHKPADDGKVQTVVVTATKRLQSVREVPQTVEAFSQRMLEDMGAKDVSDVVRATAGVEIRAPQPGVGGVAIRGVTELNLFNLTGGTGSATGLYIDEIPVTSAGFFPEINTFDLERVEVLKGPQGTLFGEGSLAGTIRLIANKPDLRSLAAALDVDAFSTKGGGKGHNANAMINVPLAKDVAGLRVTVFDREDPGYVDTKLSGTGAVIEDTNTNKTRGGRMTLRLKPAAGHTLDLTAMTSDSTRGGTTRGTEDFIGLRSVLEGNTDKINTGNITWQMGTRGVDYLVTASKMKRDLKQVTDQMGLVGLTNQLNGAFGLPSVTGVYAPQDVTTDTTAFEVRAVSNSAGALKWTLGAFYKQHDFTYHLTSQSDPLTDPAVYAMISAALSGGQFSDAFAILSDTQATTKQTALFGETTYDLSPQLQMLGGLRLFRERRSSSTEYGGVILYVPAAFGGPITPPGKVSSSASDDIVNPRVTLSYKPMAGLMTYASASRGFRSGGQNDLFFAVAGSSPTYAPEKLTSLELGMKSEHMGGRVVVDASLFSLDWTDLQTVIGEGPGGAGEVIGNIGKARSLGAELSLRARPLPELELQAGLSILDAKTRNDVTLPDPSGTGSIVVASGARIPRIARRSANLAATYRKEVLDGLNGLVRLSVSHVGESVAQLYRQGTMIEASTTLNVKAGVEGEQWSLYAYVNNLSDEKVQLFRDANDEPGTGRAQIYWGRPRTVGLNFRYNFD